MRLKNVTPHELCPATILQARSSDCKPGAPTVHWGNADGILSVPISGENPSKSEIYDYVVNYYFLSTVNNEMLRRLRGVNISGLDGLIKSNPVFVRIEDTSFEEAKREITGTFRLQVDTAISNNLLNISDPIKSKLVSYFSSNFKSNTRKKIGGFFEVQYMEIAFEADFDELIRNTIDHTIRCRLGESVRDNVPIITGVTGYNVRAWKTASDTAIDIQTSTVVKAAIQASVDSVINESIRNWNSPIYRQLNQRQIQELNSFSRSAQEKVDTPLNADLSLGIDYQSTIRRLSNQIVEIETTGQKFVPSYFQLLNLRESIDYKDYISSCSL